MLKTTNSLEDFLIFLEDKGFKFQEDVIAFIYFGKRYTELPDHLIIIAIEFTLKSQIKFDGSFYLSLLEAIKEKKINSRKEAYHFVKEIGLVI